MVRRFLLLLVDDADIQSPDYSKVTAGRDDADNTLG